MWHADRPMIQVDQFINNGSVAYRRAVVGRCVLVRPITVHHSNEFSAQVNATGTSAAY